LEKGKGEAEEKRLKEANEWKGLSERYKAELDETSGKLTKFIEREKEGKKANAVFTELSKLGFQPQYREEAFKLLDRGSVNVDEETGRVYGAETVAKEFATKYREYPWFSKQNNPANHSMPRNGNPSTSLDLAKMSTHELIEHHKKKQSR
jgi:hypothetical protein